MLLALTLRGTIRTVVPSASFSNLPQIRLMHYLQEGQDTKLKMKASNSQHNAQHNENDSKHCTTYSKIESEKCTTCLKNGSEQCTTYASTAQLLSYALIVKYDVAIKQRHA
jgi:hypothetical protein